MRRGAEWQLGVRGQSPRMTPEELGELRDVVNELFDGARILKRTVHSQISSAALWELEVGREKGSSLRLMLKDLGANALWGQARVVKPAFLRDPMREIDAYRHVLAQRQLGTAKFHGAHIDPARDRYWLFLERVEAVPLWQVGRWSSWQAAAGWLAKLHQTELPTETSSLVRYDAGFYGQWFQRASSGRNGSLLDGLEPAYLTATSLLAEASSGLVHGEYYPSNVLVRGRERQVCPIDFELFGIGTFALDLAALVTGLPSRVADRVVSTYLRALDDPYDAKRLSLLLLCGRFHLAVRWLGWSTEWKPPTQHATDWATEARRVARELEAVA